MLTYKQFKEKYRLDVGDENKDNLLDIFNNDYTFDMIKNDTVKKYMYGLKKLLVDKNEEEFKNIMNECIQEDNKDGYIGFINYYASKKEYIKALEYCKILEREQYKLGIIYCSIGHIYLKMKEPNTTDIIIDYFKKSIEYGNETSKDNIGMVLMSQNKYKEAITYFMDIRDKVDSIYYLIGVCYYNLEKGGSKYLEFVEPAGEYGNILQFLNLHEKKEYKNAIDVLKHAIKSDNIDENIKENCIEVFCDTCIDIEYYNELIEYIEQIENKTTIMKKYLGHAYMASKQYTKSYDYLLQAHREGNIEATESLFKIIKITYESINNVDQ